MKDRDQYTAGNCAAAELILCAPAKYGGEGTLQVQWARAVLEKSGETDRSEGRPLPFAAADRRESAVKHRIVHEGYTSKAPDASGAMVLQASDGAGGDANSRPVLIAPSAVRVNARSVDNAGRISPQEAAHNVGLLEGGRPPQGTGDARPAIPRHSVAQIDTGGQATGCALPRTLSPQETESKASQESAGSSPTAAAPCQNAQNSRRVTRGNGQPLVLGSSGCGWPAPAPVCGSGATRWDVTENAMLTETLLHQRLDIKAPGGTEAA